MLVGATLLPDSDTKCILFAIDMTQQKQTEQALKRRERELELITDNMPALIAYVDREPRYRYVNQRYTEWFGKPREEIIGMQPGAIMGTAAYERHEAPCRGGTSRRAAAVRE